MEILAKSVLWYMPHLKLKATDANVPVKTLNLMIKKLLVYVLTAIMVSRI